jgi:hypothetical protein
LIEIQEGSKRARNKTKAKTKDDKEEQIQPTKELVKSASIQSIE